MEEPPTPKSTEETEEEQNDEAPPKRRISTPPSPRTYSEFPPDNEQVEECHLVSREDLETALADLKALVPDPKVGIWGPDSMSWKIYGEVIVFLAGGRAALLQLAHPFVAHAIDQHSAVYRDPLGRFERTFRNVLAMAFGDLDQAFVAARRVHRVHERIIGKVTETSGPIPAGTPYAANTIDALVWVYATLIDSAAHAYQLIVGPLTDDELEQFYRESYLFAKLFGIPKEALPKDWNAFVQYNEDMYQWAAVEKVGRGIGQLLLSSKTLRPPVLADWYRVMTTGMLPPQLREVFGLPFRRRERILYGASVRALGRGYGALPMKIRGQPAYLDASRRLSGRSGRDPVGKFIERYVLQGPLGHSSN